MLSTEIPFLYTPVSAPGGTVLRCAHGIVPGTPGSIDKKNDTMTLAALGDCIIARKISVLKDPGFLRLVKLIRQADCTWANW